MARKRDIKPGFFKNEELGEVEPLARLFFAGLWCWADKTGRFEDRPKKLKADILPYDNCDGEGLMQQLADHGFVVRYEVGGNKYGQIVNWDKHQSPHPKEAESNIPAPDSPLEKNIKATENTLPLSCDTITDNLEATENTLQAGDEQRSSNPIPSFTSMPSFVVDTARACEDQGDHIFDAGEMVTGIVCHSEHDAVFQEVAAAIQQVALVAKKEDHELITDMVEHYPRDWLIQAIKIAVDKKARSFGYVDRILGSWRRNGFRDNDKPWEVEKRGKHRTYGRDRPSKKSPGKQPSEIDWENEPDHL